MFLSVLNPTLHAVNRCRAACMLYFFTVSHVSIAFFELVELLSLT
jgi:hypothetical protein